MSNNGTKFSVLKSWPVANWEWPKIAVFVPMVSALPYADNVFFNFLEIAQGGVPFFRLPYARTDVARNRGAQALLDSEFTHILMLDSDHPHPIDIVQRLARRVIEDPERLVVAALAFRRGEPYDPLVWVKKDDGVYAVVEWEENSLIDAYIVGTPAMLIHRSVFEQISKPWFYYDYTEINQPNFSWPTEDVGFCKKVCEAGIHIYCDTSIVTPHMRSVTVDENTYRTWQAVHPEEQADPLIERKAMSIANLLGLTPAELTRQVQDGGLNVNEAWNEKNPQTAEEVREFYGKRDNGYFLDLLYWNTTQFYKTIVEPLRSYSGKNALVIGPGIGGEIDQLLDNNRVVVKELPGAMKDWLFDFYGDKIEDFYETNDAPDYDLIVAVDVIEHIHPDELETFLETIGEILAPGGTFYCHCNFGQRDLYPMHYWQNEDIFNAWIGENFTKTGDYSYQKIAQEVMA